MSIVDKFNFHDKVILVTGASSGIGRQMAISFSELGSKIIAVARREEELKQTLEKLTGHGHRFYAADLSEIEAIKDLMVTIVKENGPLNGLVYCAGKSQTCPIKSISYAYALDMMNLNYFAFLEMVKQFTKKGNYAEGASIVGISSTASKVNSNGQTVYAASKAGMEASVRVIANELIKKEIRINTISPGWVRTKMYEDFMNQWENAEELIRSSQPLGVIEPEEIASMAAYLLSPAARCITGQDIIIGGGTRI